MEADLIKGARRSLEKSRHERCFDKLDEFFEELNADKQSLLHDLRNHFRTVKTRYYHLKQEKEKGTISNQDYDMVFNKISNALYSFFDSVLEECHIDEKSKGKQLSSEFKTLNVVLVIDEEFSNFSEEKARILINSIRDILQLPEKDFRYLNLKEGSVIIELKVKRSYNLITKLKSLGQIIADPKFLLVQVSDKLFDEFCSAFVQIQLNFENVSLIRRTLTKAEIILKKIRTRLKKKGLIEKGLIEKGSVEKRVKIYWSILRELNLRGLYLSGLNLSNEDLSNKDLSRLNLSRLNFKGTDLNGATLIKTDLTSANLSKADLTEAILSDANLTNSIFIKAKLISADLRDAKLIRTNMQEAELSGANLRETKLIGVNLSYASFNNAVLNHAKFENVNLQYANFVYASLYKVQLIDCEFLDTIFHIDQRSQVIQMGIDLNLCIFIEDDGNNVHKTI